MTHDQAFGELISFARVMNSTQRINLYRVEQHCTEEGLLQVIAAGLTRSEAENVAVHHDASRRAQNSESLAGVFAKVVAEV